MSVRRSPHTKLVITQELIDTSIRASSGHCMIADAVRDAVPAARNISVDLQTIRWTDPDRGVRYVYLTPPQAQLALVDFDEGNPVHPFYVTVRNAYVATVRKRTPRIRPDVVVPGTPRHLRGNAELHERNLAELKTVVLRLIDENGEVPSGRTVARELGKTDDHATRTNWDKLTARGELPARHRDMPAIIIEGGPTVETKTLGNERRVYGIKQLRLSRRT
jgi:hypothetical protein